MKKNNMGEFNINMSISSKTRGSPYLKPLKLPLRLLIAGDFLPVDKSQPDKVEQHYLVDITRRNFNIILEQLNPNLQINIPNHVTDDPSELTIDLNFSDLRDFRPESVVKNVAELSSLFKLRTLISHLKQRRITVTDFRQQLHQTGAEGRWVNNLINVLIKQQMPKKDMTIPKPALPSISPQKTNYKEGSLDSLLDIVDIGETATDQSTKHDGTISSGVEQIDQMINTVIGTGKQSINIDKAAADEIIEDLDRTLTAQVNEILHNDKFQQLEAAWRGLKFLVDRIDFNKNITLEILSTSRDKLVDVLQRQLVEVLEHDIAAIPYTAICLDFEFDNTSNDIQILYRLAEIMSDLNIPLITSARASLLGLTSINEIVNIKNLKNIFSQQVYREWNEFRQNEKSCIISMTISKFVLRWPYSAETDRVRDFNFNEAYDSDGNGYLFGNGSYFLAVAIANSYAATNWCSNITGLRNGGAIDGLPLREYKTSAGKKVQIPLNIMFPGSILTNLINEGFIVFNCMVNRDTAYIVSAPSIHKPSGVRDISPGFRPGYNDLPYQLFISRLIHYVHSIKQEIAVGLSPEQLQELLRSKLTSIITPPDVTVPADSVKIQIKDNESNPQYYLIAVTIKPPVQILRQNIEVQLQMEINH